MTIYKIYYKIKTNVYARGGDFIIARQLELFKTLSDEELKKLLEITFIKDYEPGMVLFNEGMDGDVM